MICFICRVKGSDQSETLQTSGHVLCYLGALRTELSGRSAHQRVGPDSGDRLTYSLQDMDIAVQSLNELG